VKDFLKNPWFLLTAVVILGGLLLIAADISIINRQSTNALSRSDYDQLKGCSTDPALVPNRMGYLTYFNCGHVTKDNGKTLREFSLVVNENITTQIADGPINFEAWTFNHTLPGPTIRVTEGDHVKITVINNKENKFTHSLHMHSVHPGSMDGTMLNGLSGAIKPGSNFTYDFVAGPAGVYPYHCHVDPISMHINHGLYGVLIIDPKTPRPPANEMVMLLNGYDFSDEPYPRMPNATEAKMIMEGNETVVPQEHDNSLYTVNGYANYYMMHPIDLKMHEKYRIYLVNMLDFEENSYHLHGQMFDYYPAGTSMKPSFKTDMINLDQGDRGILEFTFDLPGCFMFHAHKSQVADRGWSGAFNVEDSAGQNGCIK
jgi:FtsP/CotA-like multicopper oxidase with cupredoxin domain